MKHLLNPTTILKSVKHESAQKTKIVQCTEIVQIILHKKNNIKIKINNSLRWVSRSSKAV